MFSIVTARFQDILSKFLLCMRSKIDYILEILELYNKTSLILHKENMSTVASTIKNFVIVVILYLLLIIVLPANRAAMHEYHLSPLQYHILLFVIVLPIIGVWFAAFFGYSQLKRYADAIHRTKHDKDFDQLSRGFRWLVWGFPIPSIVSLILNSIVNSHQGFKAADTILVSYLTLIISVVGFSIISSGSRGLIDHGKLQISSMAIKILVLIFVIIGTLYCFLTFRQLNLKDASSTNNPFYLPVWLLITTVTIPYLYAWFAGLFAAYEIALFGKHADGVLYQKPLRILAIGVMLVIAGSISLQYVTSVEPRTLHLSLNALLITTYSIRFVAAAGYLLLAFGAIRLRKIEEV
jgi:hypothetical protein